MAFDAHNENEEQTPVKPINGGDSTTTTVTVDGESMTVEEALQRHSGTLDALMNDRDENTQQVDDMQSVIDGVLEMMSDQDARIDILEQQVGELYEAVEFLAEAASGTDESIAWDYRNAKP